MNAHAAAGIGHNSAAIGEMVKEEPAIVFRDEAILPALLREIDGEIEALEVDLSTESGRKAIASLSYSISRRKTPIIDAGKALTEDWRKKTAAVNALKSTIEQELDARRDRAREPLTKWEAAEKTRQDRVTSAFIIFDRAPVAVPVSATLEEVDQIIAQVEAIAIDDDFQESKARGEAAKADALSKLEGVRASFAQAAEERAELARLRAAQEERDREAVAERQRQESAAAEKQRLAEAEKRAADEAEARIRAEADKAIAAEREKAQAAAQALADEQRRQREAKEAEEQRAAEQAAEEARRQADVEHRSNIMRSAKEALMEHGGIGEATAKKIVLAIVAGTVPAVTLKF